MQEPSADRQIQPPIEEAGWPSLVVGQDGKIYTPNGIPVTPNHFIGPQRWHKELFTDYERTFGRGRAKYETHKELTIGTEDSWKRRFGEGYEKIRRDYDAIQVRYGQAMSSGNPEDGAAVNSELQSFRNRYPKLYEDIPNPNKPKPKIKIK